MSDRGEQRKGPIIRYGRGGGRKDHARRPDPGPQLDAAPPVQPPSAQPPNVQPITRPTFVTATRRRAVGGSGLRLMFLSVSVLIVIAAVALPLVNLGSSIHIPTFPVANPPTTSTPSQTRPHATSQPSQPAYLTASGMRAGLAHLARLAPRARLALVRVASNSLMASASLPNGTFKQLVLEPTGTFQISEPSPGERALPLSLISPRAVARIVATLRSRFRVPARRIDYIVLSSPTGGPTQWIAFTKAPGHPGYSATLSGTHLTRLPG